MYNILYQINPMCLMCKEEHMRWIIRLTDEEQPILDYHTEEHTYERELYALFSEPPIVITRCFCGYNKEQEQIHRMKTERDAQESGHAFSNI